MKKIKRIIPILFVFVMSFALVIATACSSCNDENAKTLDSIALDLSDAQTGYFEGGAFTAEGVKVVAHYTDSAAYPDEVLAHNAAGVSVNSAAFNGSAAGKYEISVSYTVGDVTKSASYTAVVVGEDSAKRLKIDVTGAKTKFLTTEDFNADGLRVFVVADGPDGEIDIRCATDNYFINSNQYAKAVGKYMINVGFATEEIYLESEYEVEVIAPRAGVDVRLKSGVQQYYVAGSTGADLSDFANWVEVRVPDGYGIVDENSAPLASDQYTVSLWLGKTQITNPTGLGKGAYQVLVSYQGHESFALIFVEDLITKIERTGGETEQIQSSLDRITSTWTYTATYESGATGAIPAADVKVTDFKPSKVGEGTATLTYEYKTYSGEVKTATGTAAYTILSPGSAQTKKYEYSFAELTAKVLERTQMADKIALTAADFATEKNSFLTFVSEGAGSSDQLRTNSDKTKFTCFEIKGDRLQVTFSGKGTLTVGFSSTGGSNVSALGLKAADGTVIAGTPVDSSVTILDADAGDAKAGYAKITGTSEGKVLFDIPAAGTYTISSIYPTDTSTRGARIYSIVMEDIVGGKAAAASLDEVELLAIVDDRRDA